MQEIDLSKIDSPVLRQLIEEVRNESREPLQCYNRMHNRHNRSGSRIREYIRPPRLPNNYDKEKEEVTKKFPIHGDCPAGGFHEHTLIWNYISYCPKCNNVIG